MIATIVLTSGVWILPLRRELLPLLLCNSLWGTLGRPFDKSTTNPLPPPLYTYTLAFLINFMQFVQPATTRTAGCKKQVCVKRGWWEKGCKGGATQVENGTKGVVRWERVSLCRHAICRR